MLTFDKKHFMIQSMTGFGKAESVIGNKKIVVEIKSVNSKGLDIYTKIPSIYREKEIEMRKIIGNTLQRGKVECAIFYDVIEEVNNVRINHALIASYKKELDQIQQEQGISSDDLLGTLLKMPDVYKTERNELSDEEWAGIENLIINAVKDLNDFRSSEGQSIQSDFESNVDQIESFLKQVEPYEGERVNSLKERINSQLEEIAGKVEVDENRLEQELIYYIEKFDVNEEKVRLKNHCDYFRETLMSDSSNGKKLGFIAQEMGREINTLGSKANHSEIQKLVVQMKDCLEKIKEQVLNVL